MKSVEEKYQTVIDRNTYYYYDAKFEEASEGTINSLKETLLALKNKIDSEGLKPEIFEDLIVHKKNGLKVLLTLTGVSNETLKRLITIIRIVDDRELSSLVYKDKWSVNEIPSKVKEWSDIKISKLIDTNEFFRKGIVRLFFEGATVPFLVKTLPLFELKKLSISKLNFDFAELIDTLVRYKEKGSYSGKKGNNPESLIEDILNDLGISFEKGDLSELVENAPNEKRNMDFIIPNKKTPSIIIESSFLVTTSSGQGDKSKTEINIDNLIKANYPKAAFWGFVDGIGWYVRKNDMRRMVNAYEDVFTYHKDELDRFKTLLVKVLG